jgi:hypothetical protein
LQLEQARQVRLLGLMMRNEYGIGAVHALVREQCDKARRRERWFKFWLVMANLSCVGWLISILAMMHGY